MLRFATENSASRWAERFLSQLEETRNEARPTAERLSLDEPAVALRVRDARRPLLLFDYDGTLRSFENDPRAATPGSRLRELLARLAESATVYIVSGRTAETLDGWFGGLGIGLVCEHGLMIKAPNGNWRRRAQVTNEALRRLVEPLFRDFVRRTPGSSIELKSAGIAWHYRAAEPEFGTFQANLLLTLLEDMLKRRPYTVLPGARVIEVRQQSVSKGRALKQLLRRHHTSDLLFCAGDDRTDEEMMAAIPDTWRARSMSCWVGSRSGRARYWVESSAAFLEQLEAFARLRSGRRRSDDGARRGDGALPSSPHAAAARGAGARILP
jgi:trehalose 6-phosphate synthase/phosphatase